MSTWSCPLTRPFFDPEVAETFSCPQRGSWAAATSQVRQVAAVLPRECHEGFVASDLGHCCGTARCHECRWECFLERLVLLGHHVRNRLKGTPRRKATPKIRLEAVMRAAQQKMPGLHGAWRGSPGIVRLRRHGPVAAAVRTERVAVMAASL